MGLRGMVFRVVTMGRIAADLAPENATKSVYASIFTSSKKSDFKETFTCRSLPLAVTDGILGGMIVGSSYIFGHSMAMRSGRNALLEGDDVSLHFCIVCSVAKGWVQYRGDQNVIVEEMEQKSPPWFLFYATILFVCC